MNIFIPLILCFALVFNPGAETNPLLQSTSLGKLVTNLNFNYSDKLEEKTYNSTGIRANALQVYLEGDTIKLMYDLGKEVTTLDRALYTLVAREILSPENAVIVNVLLENQLSKPTNKDDFIELGGLAEYKLISSPGKAGVAIKSKLAKPN